jgi:putative hemolysin
MSELAIELLLIFLLTIVNGTLAMSEIAIVSARKARLQHSANTGDQRARAALDLAKSPNLFLSTTQIGITLVSILAGAFGGATIASRLAKAFDLIAPLQPYSQAISLGIVVLLITYFSLIIGELVPKRLALNNPERVAAIVASPMRSLSRLTSPLVRLLSFSTDAILGLFGIKVSQETPVTEEEIKIMIQQATQAGTFEEAEQDMVEQVFRLGDRRVSALMTPRPDIVWLDLDDPLDVNQNKIARQHHSNYVVCRGSLDNVLGVVHVKDILAQSLGNSSINLESLLIRPLFVPENMRAIKLLEQFKQSGVHIALAVDEYGVVQGLMTLNDILQAIVGELPTPNEPARPDIIQREDGSWLVDGMLPIDEIKELLGVEKLPGEDQINFQTLGGLMMSQLGHVPLPADHFEWRQWHFEIVDMDGKRVDKVLISKSSHPDRRILHAL